jgi:hypothetical protein
MICAYILYFLDAHLKEKLEVIAQLENIHRTTQSGLEPYVEYVPVGATLPEAYTPTSQVPPTPRQLRRYFDEQGLDATLAVLEQFWSEDASLAIYDQTYGFVWVFDLLGKGETTAVQALYEQYGRFQDNGVTGAFMCYCNVMQLIDLGGVARDCFERLLTVDPEHSEAGEKLRALSESVGNEEN